MNTKMIPKSKAIKEANRRKKLTNEEYAERLLYLYEGQIINTEEYKNSRTSIMHHCIKHNLDFLGFPQSLLNGSTACPECQKENFHNRNLEDIESIRIKVEEKYKGEYQLLPNQEYNGFKNKLWFLHYPNTPNQHLVYSRPSRIMADCDCPVCSGSQICKGYNDCATLKPEIAALITNEEDKYKYGPYSNHKIYFTCPICKTLLYKTLNQVSRDGNLRCSNCSDGITYPNKIIYNIISQVEDLDYIEREYNPDWCVFPFREGTRRGKYDLYFEYNKKKYIIEMDGGIGHGNKVMGKITKQEALYIDGQKDELALDHNIEVIRINAYYPNEQDKYIFIKEQIVNSRLSDILPIDKIDFDKANIDSQKSVLVQCCKLWNEGKTSGEICNILNIGEWLVSSYLKKGNEYKLCNYDALSSIRRSFCKSIICINNKQIYETISDAANYYNIDSKGISRCCKGIDYSAGKDKTTGEKLFWMYYDEYKKMTEAEIKEYVYEKIRKGKQLNTSNPVVNVYSNTLYLNLASAVKDSGVSYKTINDYCNININENENFTKYKRAWMRLDNYSEIKSTDNLKFYGFMIEQKEK